MVLDAPTFGGLQNKRLVEMSTLHSETEQKKWLSRRNREGPDKSERPRKDLASELPFVVGVLALGISGVFAQR